TCNVLAGGHYRHDVNVGTIPTATWATGSSCDITGMTSGGSAIGTLISVNGGALGMNQNFSSVTWNCPAQSAFIAVIYNSIPIDVRDSFVVYTTNNNFIDFSESPATYSVTWSGDFRVHG